MENEIVQYQAPRTVKVFYCQAHKHYSQHDEQKLSNIFKQLYFEHKYDNLTLQSWSSSIKFSADYALYNDPLTPHFVKILDFIKEYHISKKSRQWQTAFDLHMKLVLECLELIKEIKLREDLWILKPLRTLIRATKRILNETMKHVTSSQKLKSNLINTLNRFKSTRSLLVEVLVQILPLIENMQVSILFNFHNYEMIKMIVYTSKLSLDPENKFRDNFLFLKAKYALVNEKFKQAQQHFEMINVKTVAQKRLLLKYLIPCKIFLGKMFEPRENVLDEHFPEYEKLIKAINKASFRDFDNVVEKYQKVWIKRGIYLLMDRLRILVWRNLIKRVYYVFGQKIMIDKIEKAVKMAGGDESLNQCICIIGNLIFEGYLKGFVFQNQQIKGLVLRKDKGFPKLSEIITQ